uniref:ODAD1 central coiled coil region domain-containing protein n=1 Tax=Stomoxys calcitrans TaxID=35570 RepID=A0A1I8P7W5_STOCA
MDNMAKKNFLQVYLSKQKELSKQQREYKKILSTKLKSRKETIIEARYQNAIEQLKQEKDDLKAQIWVANGWTHVRENKRCLRNIKGHVATQEKVTADIGKLKVDIRNLEREIGRVDRQIYELNRQTVPENQHQAHVAKVRRKMSILENQLELSIRRECTFTAANAELREELVKVVNQRTLFNESYSKLVQKLNSDKKYLIELIEYALGKFDNCIDIYAKIDNTLKKETKERNLRRLEMQDIMRKIAADSDTSAFMETKGKARDLAALQPKEVARREKFRQNHQRKIGLYNKILEKIQDYTQTQNVEKIIEKFQQQESLYYSYFNYANELSYHMTHLTNSVDRLYQDIDSLKKSNVNTLQNQLETIEHLEQTLAERKQKNSELQKVREANDQRLYSLLQGIETLFKMSHCDASPLKALLGNHSHVDLFNVRRFLKILEKRIFDITASVYVLERQDEAKSYGDYVVKQIEKICEWPTDLDDIVLTQQCAECAEAEALNGDDGGDGAVVNSIEQTKEKLCKKVVQPEMQYHLHSITQCRMPRSRILAAKRNA